MENNELKAILLLLEDPDREIFETLYHSFIDRGVNAIPDLEMAWELSDNTETQGKLENIIHKIQVDHVHNSLINWVKDGACDLIEGAYIVAKYQFPELDIKDIQLAIDQIKQDALEEMNENLTPLEKVRILNHIVFDIHRYTSNTTNYYSPQNAYINQVIISKKGNPISLGIIYAAIAQKIGLSIYGVNLPKNFVLAFKDESSNFVENGYANDILFYINPFNRGAVLGRKEIDLFLKQQNITPDEMFYRPCSNVEIIQRLLLSLIYSYEKLGYDQKIKDLQVLLKIAKMSNSRPY